MGHDTIKVGKYSKQIEKEFDYFLVPTQLYEYMQQELIAGQLNKQFIDLQTLRLINNPKRFDVNKFMQEGIV
jgi:isocitrate/isopropylmalate dehydrogenase